MMKMRRTFCFMLYLLPWLVICLASAPGITVKLKDGQRCEGEVKSITATSVLIQTETGITLNIARDRVISPVPELIQSAQKAFANGDCVRTCECCRHILLWEPENETAKRLLARAEQAGDVAEHAKPEAIVESEESYSLNPQLGEIENPHIPVREKTTQESAELAGAQVQNFSFLHMSDSHISPFFSMPAELTDKRSYASIRTIKDLGEVQLQPYQLKAPRPSFIVHTGDIAEYSFPGVTWDLTHKYFEGLGMPVYYVAGNHDNTWVMDTQTFERLHGGMNYSFDYGGCHFTGICSASYQEPVPSLGEEVINFVKTDLEKVDDTTPVFVFFHHPLTGKAFCSQYDVDRLLDALRTDNVVLTMYGHGHSAVRHNFSRIDGVEGGSTFTKGAPGKGGFNIVNLKDRTIYVAYKKSDEAEATKGLLEKKIPTRASYPAVAIQSPGEYDSIAGEQLTIRASISGAAEPITRAFYAIDDELNGELKLAGGNAEAVVSIAELCNGAHFLRVNFAYGEEKSYHKSITFFVENSKAKGMGSAKWRYHMKGASKATPLVHMGTVYAGANDGIFYALDENTGDLKWTFDAGAEILSSAAAWKDLILFGAGNGKFYALTTEGKPAWVYKAGSAVYSSPVVDKEGIVYFGDNNAVLVALNAETGKPAWINSDARHSIESTPFVTEEHVFYGAWDGYLYCVNKKDGKLVWKKPGPRNQERVIRYYAPADNGPVVAGGKVFIADRGYFLGAYGLDGSYLKEITRGCSAISLSEDGTSLYLRGVNPPVRKVSLDGQLLWRSSVVAGRLPISPTEKDNVLYVCTNTGRLHALDPATGATKWHYQVTPQLYVMSGVSVNNGVVFTSGMDGFVTAVTALPTP